MDPIAWLCRLRSILTDESGQDLVEYGILVFFIAVVVIIALTATGITLVDVYFNRVVELFSSLT